MAYDHPIETDDGAIPVTLRRFLRNRLYELVALVMFAAIIAVALALATWSIADPSFNHAVDATPGNLLGYPGAVIADELMQLLGLGVLFVIAIPAAWAARLLGHQGVARPIRSVFLFVIAVFPWRGFHLGAADSRQLGAWRRVLAAMPAISLFGGLTTLFALGLDQFFAGLAAAVILGILTLASPLPSRPGHRLAPHRLARRLFQPHRPGRHRQCDGRHAPRLAELAFARQSCGAKSASRARMPSPHCRKNRNRPNPRSNFRPKVSWRASSVRCASTPSGANRRSTAASNRAWRAAHPMAMRLPVPGEDDARTDEAETDEDAEGDEADDEEEEAPARKRVSRGTKEIKQGKRLKKDAQPGFGFSKADEFTLPPLTLLAEPKKSARGSRTLRRGARTECPHARRRAR